mgnify:FL=1
MFTQLLVLVQQLRSLLQQGVGECLALLLQAILLQHIGSLGEPRLSLILGELAEDLLAKTVRLLLKPLGRVLSVGGSGV